MRKLASVRTIKALNPIPDADFIECATIDGWELVVKKGDFQVGDLCVYFEIDSILPAFPLYEFLGRPKVYDNVLGHRIKTARMRKQISQGLAMPIASFMFSVPPELDQDLTEMLGVRKYEHESTFTKDNPGGAFPAFLRKSDQERIQNRMRLFETHKDHSFEVTRKLDGSSITIYNRHTTRKGWFGKLLDKVLGKKQEFGVCSRNLRLKEPDNLDSDSLSPFWFVTKKHNLKLLLEDQDIALQGELVAPNIQGNHEKVEEPMLYIYNIYDIKLQRFMLPMERHEWMARYGFDFGLTHVPVVDSAMCVFEEIPDIQHLLAFVEGESMNPGTISEGMVFKSLTNPELSFKCISNKYLLKCEK